MVAVQRARAVRYESNYRTMHKWLVLVYIKPAPKARRQSERHVPLPRHDHRMMAVRTANETGSDPNSVQRSRDANAPLWQEAGGVAADAHRVLPASNDALQRVHAPRMLCDRRVR